MARTVSLEKDSPSSMSITNGWFSAFWSLFIPNPASSAPGAKPSRRWRPRRRPTRRKRRSAERVPGGAFAPCPNAAPGGVSDGRGAAVYRAPRRKGRRSTRRRGAAAGAGALLANRSSASRRFRSMRSALLLLPSRLVRGGDDGRGGAGIRGAREWASQRGRNGGGRVLLLEQRRALDASQLPALPCRPGAPGKDLVEEQGLAAGRARGRLVVLTLVRRERLGDALVPLEPVARERHGALASWLRKSGWVERVSGERERASAIESASRRDARPRARETTRVRRRRRASRRVGAPSQGRRREWRGTSEAPRG